jgi:hypothetical protein
LTKPATESGGSWKGPGNGAAEVEVLGVVVDGVARAYPVGILTAHWVVNDVVAGRAIALFWDPIARAAAAYQATLDRNPRGFGATGLFYRGNALFLEAETGSLFLPVLGRFVTGPLARRPLRPLVVLTCDLTAWVKLHPETRVLSSDTGYAKSYQTDPYREARGASAAVEMIRSAAADPAQRLAPTEEVLGFVATDGKAYCCAVSRLPEGDEAKPLEFGGARVTRTAQDSAHAILPGGVWPQQVECTYSAWYGVHLDTEVWPGTAGTGDR